MTTETPASPNVATQVLCAWCSPIATALWLVGFLGLAGFAPPLDPNASAAQIQSYYLDHTNMIRAGMCVTMLGAAFLGPFYSVITVQMRRIEGHNSPLAYAQLGLGVVTILLFVIPCFMFGTAAFRSDRDPQLVLLLNDTGWLPFVGAYQTTFIQLLAIAICIFQDREQKVLPRWLGYFTLWAAFLLLPAGFVLFVRTGPFAWNGMLAFWLVLVVFVTWFLVMAYEMRRAALNQSREAARGRDAVGTAHPAHA